MNIYLYRGCCYAPRPNLSRVGVAHRFMLHVYLSLIELDYIYISKTIYIYSIYTFNTICNIVVDTQLMF